MILSNVSFGIYAFMPQGWIFMICIIAIECLGMSHLLTQKWIDKKVFKTVIISNVTSGIVGIAGSILLNGGWWLVVWFPWVSDHEVGGGDAVKWLMIFYAIAFVLTLIIEGIANCIMLRNDFTKSSTIKSTIILNIVTYVLGTSVMYSYSF